MVASLNLANKNNWTASGALSASAVNFSGLPISGGTTSTTTPLVYIGNGFVGNVNGTALGISTTTKVGGGTFAGDLINAQQNGNYGWILNVNGSTVSTNFSNSSGIFAGTIANGSSGEIRYTTASTYYPTFYSNGAEAMRISVNKNVLIGTTTDITSSVFQVASTTQASIPMPIMTTTQQNAISPVKGLQIFDNVLNAPAYYNGSTWINLSTYAPLASPALTGTPTAPTATVGTNTTQIATTAFVLANGITNPMTTLGDIIYGAASGVATRLAGNTTTTQKFLTQTGTGSASAAPAYFDLFGSNNTFAGQNTFGGQTTFNSPANFANVGGGFTIQIHGELINNNYSDTLQNKSGTIALTSNTVSAPNSAISILASNQTTLVAGTIALSITGVTSGSHAQVTSVSQGGTVVAGYYEAVCTSGTLTITAKSTSNVTNTLDTSTLNYFVTN